MVKVESGEILVGYQEKVFYLKVVGHWSRIPREVAISLSLTEFKCLNIALRPMV